MRTPSLTCIIALLLNLHCRQALSRPVLDSPTAAIGDASHQSWERDAPPVLLRETDDTVGQYEERTQKEVRSLTSAVLEGGLRAARPAAQGFQRTRRTKVRASAQPPLSRAQHPGSTRGNNERPPSNPPSSPESPNRPVHHDDPRRPGDPDPPRPKPPGPAHGPRILPPDPAARAASRQLPRDLDLDSREPKPQAELPPAESPHTQGGLPLVPRARIEERRLFPNRQALRKAGRVLNQVWGKGGKGVTSGPKANRQGGGHLPPSGTPPDPNKGGSQLPGRGNPETNPLPPPRPAGNPTDRLSLVPRALDSESEPPYGLSSRSGKPANDYGEPSRKEERSFIPPSISIGVHAGRLFAKARTVAKGIGERFRAQVRGRINPFGARRGVLASRATIPTDAPETSPILPDSGDDTLRAAQHGALDNANSEGEVYEDYTVDDEHGEPPQKEKRNLLKIAAKGATQVASRFGTPLSRVRVPQLNGRRTGRPPYHTPPLNPGRTPQRPGQPANPMQPNPPLRPNPPLQPVNPAPQTNSLSGAPPRFPRALDRKSLRSRSNNPAGDNDNDIPDTTTNPLQALDYTGEESYQDDPASQLDKETQKEKRSFNPTTFRVVMGAGSRIAAAARKSIGPLFSRPRPGPNPPSGPGPTGPSGPRPGGPTRFSPGVKTGVLGGPFRLTP